MTDETPEPTAPEPTVPVAKPGAPEPPSPGRALASANTPAHRPEYKGAELDPERGPGLGCFWFQMIVLGFFVVLIPIGLNLNWPFELLAFLLFVVIGLLLLTGQSVIFLLRLVAADRRARGRRRPLASPTKTVGELEDEHLVAHAVGGAPPVPAERPAADDPAKDAAAVAAETPAIDEPAERPAADEPAEDAAAVAAETPAIDEPAERPAAHEPAEDAAAVAAEAEPAVDPADLAEPAADEAEPATDGAGATDAATNADDETDTVAPDEPPGEEPDPGVRQ